jgi:hypothetical protein
LFDGLLRGIDEEVTINDRGNDESECLVFQAADVIDDTSRCAVSGEVSFNNGRNGDDDDCALSQDASSKSELMPSETSKREENKETMVDMELDDTLSSAVTEGVLTVDRRNGGDVCVVSKDTDRNIKLMPSVVPQGENIMKKLWMIRYIFTPVSLPLSCVGLATTL